MVHPPSRDHTHALLALLPPLSPSTPGLTPSVFPSTSLIQPLVGGLCPYLVQGVRTADVGGGWSAVEGDTMGGAAHIRSGMLEAAGNLLTAMADPRMAAGK